MRPETRNWIVIAIGLFAALLIATGSIVYRETRNLFDNSDRVAHTHQVLTAIESAQSMVTDAETALRGRLVSGKDEFLESYHAAVARRPAIVNELRELTVDNAEQQKRIAQLDKLVTERIDIFEQVLQVYDQDGGLAAVQERQDSFRGSEKMAEVRKLTAEMKDAERELLAK